MIESKLLKAVRKRFFNLAESLPSEDNHNFNRNSIQGIIKNEVLILEKEFKE